jgi:hypothetical protein
MPFTFSHPAILLPLNYFKRSRLSQTGLIVGSVIPDFEYFIWMEEKKEFLHSWIGFTSLGIPLALILCFLFHNILRCPLIENMPASIQIRLCVYKSFDWNTKWKKHWFWILLSIFTGGVSHFFWDYFTHANSPLLTMFVPARFFSLLYVTLQIFSSLLGLLVIGYAIWQLPKNTCEAINKNISTYWKQVLVFSFSIFLIRVMLAKDFSIKDALIASMASLLIAILAVSFLKNKYHSVD